MKYFNTTLLVFATALMMMSCTSNTNDPEFLEKVSGRYLFNADETVLIYAKDDVLLLDWRGATAIEPSKLNDDTFYVKEMNAKIQFLTNPADQKDYLVFLPKNKEDSIEYVHKKMDADEKIPSKHLEDGNYQKALEGYLAIKKQDSLSPIIRHWDINRKGYYHLRKGETDLAIDIFKINVALHPTEPNVYDSLGEAYLKTNDTIKAIENYEKALKYDSGNNRLKRKLEKLRGEEVNNTN